MTKKSINKYQMIYSTILTFDCFVTLLHPIKFLLNSAVVTLNHTYQIKFSRCGHSGKVTKVVDQNAVNTQSRV
jgi:hypothetical protein